MRLWLSRPTRAEETRRQIGVIAAQELLRKVDIRGYACTPRLELQERHAVVPQTFNCKSRPEDFLLELLVGDRPWLNQRR
mgnify:CR=1 FL=1